MYSVEVRNAREAKRLARKTLAEMVGIEWRYLANIENQGAIPSLPVMIQLILLGTYANFLEDKITGNDRDLTVTETGEIQQRCRELLEKCREP